jgi:hypothetical protein
MKMKTFTAILLMGLLASCDDASPRQSEAQFELQHWPASNNVLYDANGCAFFATSYKWYGVYTVNRAPNSDKDSTKCVKYNGSDIDNG